MDLAGCIMSQKFTSEGTGLTWTNSAILSCYIKTESSSRISDLGLKLEILGAKNRQKQKLLLYNIQT